MKKLALPAVLLLIHGSSSRCLALDLEVAWAVTHDEVHSVAVAAIGVDEEGKLYVAGNTAQESMVLKYDASGNSLWVIHPGPSLEGHPVAVLDLALAPEGSFWITGYASILKNQVFEHDYYTAKYSSDGQLIWEVRTDTAPGDPSTFEYSQSIVLDRRGNSYVSGVSIGRVTVKYDADGRELWRAQFTPGLRNLGGLAVDEDENVYIAGTGSGVGGDNFTTVKYHPDGREAWVAHRFNGGYTLINLSDLALDADGNVYVTGYGNRTEGFCLRYLTIKYDSTGSEVWVSRFLDQDPSLPCGAQLGDKGRALGIGPDGRVYVTGDSFRREPLGVGLGTVAYESFDGSEVWVSRHDGALFTRARDLALDARGDIYVLGVEYHSLSQPTIGVVKYDPDGNEVAAGHHSDGLPQWNVNNPEPFPSIMAVDRAGNVYVSTAVKGADDRFDYLTIKFAATEPELIFLRGDSDGSILSDIGDAVFTLTYLFAGGPAPRCLKSADSNDDGRIDIADAVHILSFLFNGTGAPPAPFPACGRDPTPDALPWCAEYPQCES